MPFINRADEDNVDDLLYHVERAQGKLLCRVVASVIDGEVDGDVKGHEQEYVNYEQYDPDGVGPEFRARMAIFLLMVLRLSDQLGMGTLSVRYAAAARRWRATWGQIQHATDLRSPAEARDVFSLVSVGGPTLTRKRRPRPERREDEVSSHDWASLVAEEGEDSELPSS